MKHAYTKGSLSRYRNVSKVIRKKISDAHAKLKGLAMVCMSKGITRYMANRNNDHPSYDHVLKHDTSLVDPHWLSPRIDFLLDPSTMQRLIGSTP